MLRQRRWPVDLRVCPAPPTPAPRCATSATSTTVPAAPDDNGRCGATTTTVAGDTAHAARRAAGAGRVRQRRAAAASAMSARPAARVRSSRTTPPLESCPDTGWGVTVSLRGGSNGEGVWNALASECFNATGPVPDAPAGDRARRRSHLRADGATGRLHRQRADHRRLQRVRSPQPGSRARTAARCPSSSRPQAVQTVSPTLGKDSLRAAWIAGIVGVGLVFVFMILYYRLLGLHRRRRLGWCPGALIWTVDLVPVQDAGLGPVAGRHRRPHRVRRRHRRLVRGVLRTIERRGTRRSIDAQQRPARLRRRMAHHRRRRHGVADRRSGAVVPDRRLGSRLRVLPRPVDAVRPGRRLLLHPAGGAAAGTHRVDVAAQGHGHRSVVGEQRREHRRPAQRSISAAGSAGGCTTARPPSTSTAGAGGAWRCRRLLLLVTLVLAVRPGSQPRPRLRGRRGVGGVRRRT